MDLKELETIASQEMTKYELPGWTFGLTNAKRRLGVCKYRTKRIEISEYYAQHSPRESILDTLLHEMPIHQERQLKACQKNANSFVYSRLQPP
jgi:hypothetical protein